LFREQALALQLLLTLMRAPERSLVENLSWFLSHELVRALLSCLRQSWLAWVILLGCLGLASAVLTPLVGS
jgi:hypothetical protein